MNALSRAPLGSTRSQIAAGSGERGGAGPRLHELTQAVDRDPENPALLTALGN